MLTDASGIQTLFAGRKIKLDSTPIDAYLNVQINLNKTWWNSD